MSARVAAGAPAIELSGISKRFGDVVALDEVELTIRVGAVHALLGENGAGKSTLMRIAFGLTAPDSGHVRLWGAPAVRYSVAEARRAHVGMVHQHLSLVPNLTAAENLALGGRGLFRPADAVATLRRVAESSGLRVPPTAMVRDLGIVEQQRLEILKALSRDARVLILDEPTAVLAPVEVDELLRWIRTFADGGGSVVLVTHKLREALAVAHDVTVLRRGRVVHSVRRGEAGSTADDLASAIFPEGVAPPPSVARATGEPVARARDIDVPDARGVPRLRGASLELRRGEIVGLAAVEGSGHRELLAALAGVRPILAGGLELPERTALIPADRGREALIPEFSLVENVGLHGLSRRRGIMPWNDLTSRTKSLIERFAIVAPSPATRAGTLSGGNQQRLVVARELEHDVDLVVADNPTRGLDLRATAFVHERLRDAAARGAAVVVHSGDLDEILALASSVVVVFQGTLRAVPLDRDAIGRAMIGAA